MTCSVLGYGLLPVIALAGLSVVLRLKTFPVVGAVLATAAIAWSTFAAARLFDAKVREKTPPWNVGNAPDVSLHLLPLQLGLTEQYWLVVYPVVLLYSCFVLITVF